MSASLFPFSEVLVRFGFARVFSLPNTVFQRGLVVSAVDLKLPLVWWRPPPRNKEFDKCLSEHCTFRLSSCKARGAASNCGPRKHKDWKEDFLFFLLYTVSFLTYNYGREKERQVDI